MILRKNRGPALSNGHFFESPRSALTRALTVYYYVDFYGNRHRTLRNELCLNGRTFYESFPLHFL